MSWVRNARSSVSDEDLVRSQAIGEIMLNLSLRSTEYLLGVADYLAGRPPASPRRRPHTIAVFRIVPPAE